MSTPVKYQVFISSTYEDLKVQRDQVVRAVLEMGHIPVGMEMFSAADETQWQLIKRQIEASDYYIVLIAHRYGSMDGPISYTEKEYDYAVSLGIPALGFVIQDGTPWPPTMVDKDPVKANTLSTFKDKVRKKNISHWTSVDDLHAKVSIALMKQFAATPRDGWVKASTVASPQMVSELARLSQENGELREALRKAKIKDTSDQESLQARTLATLQSNKVRVSIFYEGNTNWVAEPARTLFDLFFLIAPELMVETSIDATAGFVARMWRQDRNRPLRSTWPSPSNSLRKWFADFAVLGLMEPSRRKHPAVDKTEYWTLTPLGRQVHAAIRRTRLEAGLPISEEADAGGESEGL